VSGETNILKAKINRNEQLIDIFEVIFYKVETVTKQNLSDVSRGPRSELQWNISNSNGKEKQKKKKR